MVSARISPRSQLILIQGPINGLKPKYFVCASAVAASNATGQKTINNFKLCTDQLHTQSIGKRLEYQGRRCRTESHLCISLKLSRDGILIL